MQWRQQFIQWSNITDRQIAVFTADQKEKVSSLAATLCGANVSMGNGTHILAW